MNRARPIHRSENLIGSTAVSGGDGSTARGQSHQRGEVTVKLTEEKRGGGGRHRPGGASVICIDRGLQVARA